MRITCQDETCEGTSFDIRATFCVGEDGVIPDEQMFETIELVATKKGGAFNGIAEGSRVSESMGSFICCSTCQGPVNVED